MGFKDRRNCPHLCRLASEYIRKYEGFEDDIYAFFENEPDADSLYVKLVEEFERCILSYLGFYWNYGDLIMSQVLGCYSHIIINLKWLVYTSILGKLCFFGFVGVDLGK